MGLGKLVRRVFPRLWWAHRVRHLRRTRAEYRKLTVEEAFSRIYASGAWGNGSGAGSDSQFSDVYIGYIREFISRHDIARIVDIGCGDFRVGSRLAQLAPYTGIDIVPALIEGNRSRFPEVDFRTGNVVSGSLPELPDSSRSLATVRQVLQHLSNEEIGAALENLKRYRYVLITEHVPSFPFVPNLDKPHGPDTRNDDSSGVDITAPPFRVQADVVLTMPLGERDQLMTWLVQI
ncbi:MAG TPA: class I SAM-dependent methyltransferase [Terriglobales bacterium]|nr:class I SAM-dependent methyltransferase [Terriglobales bacterium]